MKNKEVKNLFGGLESLIEYCAQNDIKNFTLNRLLIKNAKILTDEIRIIDDMIPKKLIEFEQELIEKSKEEWDKLSPEDQKARFSFALSKASKDDAEKHAELMIPYKELMEEENDIKLYKLEDTSKIDQVELPIAYHNILENFLN